MSENKSLLPDVIEPISNAIHQNLPTTEKETDGALSAVVGFFNNVMLYPVKIANLTFKYKLDAFENDLRAKTQHIPIENLQIPPTMIVGPTLEALRYTYDEKELREMYENLLASSMDGRISDFVHPSYVDTIKQMSPLDALALSKLTQVGQCPAMKITFSSPKSPTTYFARALPELYVPLLANLDNPFLVSQSIKNLSRLGLVNVINSGIYGYDYEKHLNDDYIVTQKNLYDKLDEPVVMFLSEKMIEINDYGFEFCKICLTEVCYNAD